MTSSRTTSLNLRRKYRPVKAKGKVAHLSTPERELVIQLISLCGTPSQGRSPFGARVLKHGFRTQQI